MKFFKLLIVAFLATSLISSCTKDILYSGDTVMPTQVVLSSSVVEFTYESGATSDVTVNTNAEYSTIAVSITGTWLTYTIAENVITFATTSVNDGTEAREASAVITMGPSDDSKEVSATFTQGTFTLIDLTTGKMTLASEADSSSTVTLHPDVEASAVSISFTDNSWIGYSIDEDQLTFTANSANEGDEPRESVATISATVNGLAAKSILTITQSNASAIGTYSLFDYIEDGIVYWVSEDGLTAKVLSLDQAYGVKWASSSDYASVDHSISEITEGSEATAIIVAGSDYSADNYPAIAFCKEMGDEWYMPSVEESSEFFGLFVTYGEETVQAAFTGNGGTEIALQYHFSTSESASDVSKVQMARYQTDGGFATASLSKTGTSRYTRCSKTITGGIVPESPYYSLYEVTNGGIVVAMGDDATTATIMATTSYYGAAWAVSPYDETVIGNYGVDDGAAASAAVLASSDYTAENYPAFAYCAEMGDGWYVPSYTELCAFITLYVTDLDTIDSALTAAGGETFVQDIYHLSSNEAEDAATSKKAKKAKYKSDATSADLMVNAGDYSKSGAKHQTRCFKQISK